jgi:hypothetical protein
MCPPPNVSAPSSMPTKRNDLKRHKTRRHYAFSSNSEHQTPTITPDMLGTHGIVGDSSVDKSAKLQKRTGRCHGEQTLVPNVPASPYVKTTDRARRVSKPVIRDTETPASKSTDEGTFCDITSLLQDTPKSKHVISESTEPERTNGKVVGHDEYPDMILPEDESEDEEEEVDMDYEILETCCIPSMHNGTVKRWHRGYGR